MKNWEILTENSCGADGAAVETAAKAILAALEDEDVTCDGEISLVFVDNPQMQDINNQHRGKDAPTDCLSFPQLDADELDMLKTPDHYAIFGDIIINIDMANSQAKEYAHSPQREVAFLAVHSLLHLLGYDHHDEETETKMFERQEQILQKMGLPRI